MARLAKSTGISKSKDGQYINLRVKGNTPRRLSISALASRVRATADIIYDIEKSLDFKGNVGQQGLSLSGFQSPLAGISRLSSDIYYGFNPIGRPPLSAAENASRAAEFARALNELLAFQQATPEARENAYLYVFAENYVKDARALTPSQIKSIAQRGGFKIKRKTLSARFQKRRKRSYSSSDPAPLQDWISRKSVYDASRIDDVYALRAIAQDIDAYGQVLDDTLTDTGTDGILYYAGTDVPVEPSGDE